MDFVEKMRLRGKAEEDLYFAELDRQLIKAIHEKQRSDEAEKGDEAPFNLDDAARER